MSGGVKAGTLNRYVRVQRAATENNASGEVVTAWKTRVLCWMRRSEVKNAERYQSTGVRENHLVSYETRYRRDLEVTDRIVDDGRIYRILGISEVGYHEALRIDAELLEGSFDEQG